MIKMLNTRGELATEEDGGGTEVISEPSDCRRNRFLCVERARV